MEIRFNKEEIIKSIGIDMSNNADYLNYARQLVYDLYSHNKNYTKRQYYEIEELKEILDNMEIKGSE